ncbi:hypothetical protein B9Z65_6150 [Elsinoe australis]|uniref:RNase MRP protein 1 RNA binding domain-containing protein n=1 Tax=Elsinoe australis TaxID=40998 RepID=A0A2P8A7T9_9PEZI|nr:hypothetical protein B9Z65_6150 [Elsinoe australis]
MSPLKTRLTPPALATLTHLHTLLHLLHHRNKAQHRRSHWYKSLSLLRRHLFLLVNLYTTLNSIPDTHSARHRKKSEDRLTESHVEKELLYLSDVLVPRAWRAFSQLVADLRFAVLGTFLVAVLGEVGRVLGVTGRVEEEGERDFLGLLGEFRGEWLGSEGDGTEGPGGERLEGVGAGDRVERPRERGGVEGKGGDEDVGEVVERDGDEGMVVERGRVVEGEREEGRDADGAVRFVSKEDRGAEVDAAPRTKDKKRKGEGKGESTVKKRKKKTKSGNAIDDLFAGL